MLYLVILSSLATAMFHVAAMNARGADAIADTLRARSLAESGLRWQAGRLQTDALRPRYGKGFLTVDDARAVWEGFDDDGNWIEGMRDRIAADWRGISSGGSDLVVTVTTDAVEMSGLHLPGGLIRLRVERLSDIDYTTALGARDYRQFIKITSSGVAEPASAEPAERTVSMRFSIDKRINFAVVGKTRIQLGRNTIVDGPVAMGTANKFSPYLILSDFGHFDSWLSGRLDDWHDFLLDDYAGWDNRIPVVDGALLDAARAEGFDDLDSNGFIDEFDLFLDRFDFNGDGSISRDEFTGPDGLYEPDLWAVVDSAGGPMYAGDPARSGWMDDRLDAGDLYAKVRGTVSMRDSAESWQNWLDGRGRGESIRDLMRGPLVSGSPDLPPVVFGAAPEEMIDLSPANFEEAAEIYRGRSGEAAGATVRTTRPAVDDDGDVLEDKSGNAVFETAVVKNATLSVSDAAAFVDEDGNPVELRRDEQTPYGSSSYQATYNRPVFRNMTLKNVTIPKGMNPVFENCTFEGVTFIDMTRDIDVNGSTRTDSGNGMKWSKKMKSGNFKKNVALTAETSHGFNRGNNVRFDGCTFGGPVVNPYSTAYTHFTNSWEFTGDTRFDNTTDQSATIIAPQTNIEMGSFERPGEAPSTLTGVVVAGNIDIRGVSVVDGSIIVTGDGAGNTTLGYFGSSDSDTDPDSLPEGGFGRLSIRYNPYRALPDGINIHVTVDPLPHTYREE
jgi:hypothetical protein